MTKMSFAPRLVSDVLIDIFEQLETRDIVQAILVNKDWCAVGVPFLWKEPFTIDDGHRSNIALKTYFLFLNEYQRLFFVKEVFPDATAKSLLSWNDWKPFLNYPSFLTRLDYSNLLAS